MYNQYNRQADNEREVRCFRHSLLLDSFCVFLIVIGNDRFVDGNINAFWSDLDWRQPDEGSNTLGKMEEYKQEKDEHLVAISGSFCFVN